MTDLDYGTKPIWNKSTNYTMYIVGLLQLVSACFLCYAVLNIRKHIESFDSQ
jgi:hypothetical protein